VGDEDLQRLGGVLGLLVWPEPVDEACDAAPRAQVGGQQREKVPQAGDEC
jgi:hypothetical protein